jgi:hypothetical protein
VIEGSQDGTTWTKLCDGHNENNSIINQKFSIACDCFFGMLRLRQTGKNYLGQNQLGIEFLDVFGPIVYEESPSNSPRQPDWDSVPDLTPPLSPKQFGDLIGRCFQELGPTQVMELVRRFFPGLNATQAAALTQESTPVLTLTQVIEPIKKIFPELDATQIIGLICNCFPELNRTEVNRLIRKFFPDNIKHFLPSMKKSWIQIDVRNSWEPNKRTEQVEIDVPDGIIAYLTRECGGNVHDRGVVYVTGYTSFSKNVAKNAVDLKTNS